MRRQGQIKAGDRHEKDDRSRVDDPRSWTLGWVDERKVAAPTEQLAGQQRDLNAVAKELEGAQERQETLQEWKRALARLSEYTSWEERNCGMGFRATPRRAHRRPTH